MVFFVPFCPDVAWEGVTSTTYRGAVAALLHATGSPQLPAASRDHRRRSNGYRANATEIDLHGPATLAPADCTPCAPVPRLTHSAHFEKQRSPAFAIASAAVTRVGGVDHGSLSSTQPPVRRRPTNSSSGLRRRAQGEKIELRPRTDRVAPGTRREQAEARRRHPDAGNEQGVAPADGRAPRPTPPTSPERPGRPRRRSCRRGHWSCSGASAPRAAGGRLQ